MTALAKLESKFERTAPYLRPSQIEDMQHERDQLAGMLNAPPHLRRAIQQPSQMRQTLKQIEAHLENNTPKAYVGEEIDKAAARERELRESFVADMPTAAEMRKAPPGALEKHQRFERLHVATGRVDEWKNIRLRQYAGGHLPDNLEGGAIANMEMYRPTGTSGELNMDNALIPGKQFHLGVGGAANSVTFTDDELALLQKLAPKLHGALALLSADERQEAKEALAQDTAEVIPTRENFETLNIRGLRTLCKQEGLKGDGTVEELKQKLRNHYGSNA